MRSAQSRHEQKELHSADPWSGPTISFDAHFKAINYRWYAALDSRRQHVATRACPSLNFTRSEAWADSESHVHVVQVKCPTTLTKTHAYKQLGVAQKQPDEERQNNTTSVRIEALTVQATTFCELFKMPFVRAIRPRKLSSFGEIHQHHPSTFVYSLWTPSWKIFKKKQPLFLKKKRIQ